MLQAKKIKKKIGIEKFQQIKNEEKKYCENKIIQGINKFLLFNFKK